MPSGRRRTVALRLVYIAVHELNAGWGAETFLARAFERLGHEVIRIDYRAHRGELPRLLEAAARRAPDAVLLQRGEGLAAEWLAGFEAPKVYYATERASVPEQQQLLRSHVFDACVASSRCTLQSMVDECGVPPERAHWIPSGFDRETYRALEVKSDYNVVAVCAPTRRRRRAFRTLGWTLRRKRLLSGIMGAKCNEIVNRSRIALNIHATDLIDTETRLFELLPTRAAIVSEECDAPGLFEGGAIRWFPPGDWAAMGKAVRELLQDELLRRQCVEKNNAIAASHGWDARAHAWIALMERLRSGKSDGNGLGAEVGTVRIGRCSWPGKVDQR